ncbi:hypothetical protein [Nocardia sp. NPDC049149]|uniref:hypothetical protein n=1 Tax=Nocardia sp. NPDC049149 TaxID=3364315 RepID=UPI003720B440
MKYVGSVLATVGAVLALTVGASSGANATPDAPAIEMAAKGRFEYTHHGKERDLVNPKNNQCYRIEGDGRVQNNTNRKAELYRGDNCHGKVERVLVPGERDRKVEFSSVMFVR